MQQPKYPSVTVELVGHDGNAFAILGRVRRAMKEGKVPQTEIDAFLVEAASGNYEQLIQTCMKWVDVR